MKKINIIITIFIITSLALLEYSRQKSSENTKNNQLHNNNNIATFEH